MADFDSVLSLGADTRGLKKGEDDLDRIADKGEQTERRTKKSTDGMGRSYSRVGLSAQRMSATAGKALGALAVATAAAFVAGNVISTIADFETAASKMGAISRATAADLAVMRDTAAQLGATTEFSATQAADGLGFLAMAGFQAREAVEALPPILDLATASSMDLAQAADIASNIMGAFQINASKAGSVADVLAAASSRANTSVSQLGQAISTAGPVAAGLGISLETTAAAIGVMSDAGIQAERAGTALRGSLAALSAPTKAASDALSKYGIAISEVNPETNDLADVLATLRDANLSTADAMAIFGREAASGALVMIEGAARVAELTGEIERAEGAASDMASVMRDNLGGDIKTLQSSVSALVLEMGDAGLTTVLRAVISLATSAVRVVTAMVGVVGRLTSGIGRLIELLPGIQSAAEAQRVHAAAIESVSRAMGDQINASRALNSHLKTGSQLTLEQAAAQLELARARRADVEALIAQRQEAELAALGYGSLLERITSARAALDAMRTPGDDLEQMPLRMRDAYEEAEQSLLSLLNKQRDMLVSVREQSHLRDDEQALLDQIESNIASLEARMSDTADDVSRANKQTADWGVSMKGVLGTIQAIAGVLGSISGTLMSSAAKQVQIDALRAGESIANAKIAAEDFTAQQEAAAKRAEAGGSLFKRIGVEAELAAEAVDRNRTRILASELLLAQEREAAAAGGGGGSGAGSVLDLNTDLETLVDSLKTRSEVVAEWYQESLNTLALARENELITAAEHNEALERLEQEHQDRVGGIRELGKKSQVELALGASSEVLKAMGAFSKKAAKAAAVAGAAEALVNTWRAAAQTLADPSLPYFAKFAAVASVVASGLGMVASIKGAGSGGGAGGVAAGGGGGPASTQAPAAPEQTQTLQFNITNDPFGIGENIIRQIAAQLNESSRNGTNIIAAVST